VLQIHEEAKKFSYQTGVRVVVAYGGAPITQQVWFSLALAAIPQLLRIENFCLRKPFSASVFPC
jgi:superfamily II DNA/RNA helicase